MTGVVGTRANFDQIGKVTAQKKTSRHSDTPLITTPHARRVVDLTDYEYSDLVDNEDQIRTIFDPTNPYAEAGIFAMGRAIDEEILAAANGTSTIGGSDGLTTTTEAFAGTNVTASGDGAGGTGTTGVRIEDLIAARGALRSAEHITGAEPIAFVCSSETIDDLLHESEIQSIDQNTFRALTSGEVTTFMGFTFIQTELVDGIGGASEKCYVYPRSAIRLAIGADIQTMIERRPDKSYAWNPYVRMSIGATRTQSDNVVTITVDHSD